MPIEYVETLSGLSSLCKRYRLDRVRRVSALWVFDVHRVYEDGTSKLLGTDTIRGAKKLAERDLATESRGKGQVKPAAEMMAEVCRVVAESAGGIGNRDLRLAAYRALEAYAKETQSRPPEAP